MRFSVLTTIAALTGSTLAQLKANDVVNNIQVLTTKSRNLLKPAEQLSIFNAPLLLLGQGPWAVTSFLFFGLDRLDEDKHLRGKRRRRYLSPTVIMTDNIIAKAKIRRKRNPSLTSSNSSSRPPFSASPTLSPPLTAPSRL